MKKRAHSIAAMVGLFLLVATPGESVTGFAASGFDSLRYRNEMSDTTAAGACDLAKRLRDPFECETYMKTLEQSASEEFSGGNREIDPISRDCLNCHDGAAAKDVGVAFRSRGHGMYQGGEHPIGMRYSEVASLSGRGYHPQATLPQEVVLVSGKVACVSCHNMFNPERFHLAVTDHGSRLCLTCHDK